MSRKKIRENSTILFYSVVQCDFPSIDVAFKSNIDKSLVNWGIQNKKEIIGRASFESTLKTLQQKQKI